MNLQQIYFPLLKTTDAELKGYEKLPSDIKDSILPIFELTKSRRTKKNIEGKLEKKISQLTDIIGFRPFILDLTTDIDLSNQELATMLNSTEQGHKKWRVFSESLKSQGLNIIPVVHYNENAPEESIEEAKELENKFGVIAFRADARDKTMLDYLQPILDGLKEPQNLILILDMGFIQKSIQSIDGASYAFNVLKSQMEKIVKLKNKPGKYIPIYSSFPKSVSSYGDSQGEIPLQEVLISEKLISEFKSEPITYGDYASIHPERYPGGGGWIPRIDFPLEKACFFYRSRVSNDELTSDAYIRVAKAIIADPRYRPAPNVWGIEEIEAAANGKPNGKSPSYWIAVRICLHIMSQYNRLQLKILLS